MNNPDLSLYIIIALLPLSAFLLVIQVNPFYALVIRGMLGAIAALVYAILGAGDVALTEALMGTLLAITLYVIAVRSSLVMRLGILEKKLSDVDINDDNQEKEQLFSSLIEQIKSIVVKHYLRLELIHYQDYHSLKKALEEKEVHGICFASNTENIYVENSYLTIFRIERLYNIFQKEKNNFNNNLVCFEIDKKI